MATESRFFSDKTYLICALAGCGSAVVLGAFAAHGLKAHLSEQMLDVFQTGVRYQMWHSLALIMLVLLTQMERGLCASCLNKAKGFMSLGVVLFSGSLYVLAISNVRQVGIVTPIGGGFLIAAWTFAVIAVFRAKSALLKETER